jgi:hypothetical protein
LPSRSRTHRCTPATIAGRIKKANQFSSAAELVETFTREEDLADAYVTLCIHAGIAASDVITCERLGEHAQGDDHGEAVSLLAAVDRKLAEDLRALLGMKTKAGYSALPASAEDVKRARRSAKRLVDAAQEAVRD